MEGEKTTIYYTYMLHCADGTLYSGYTTNPYRCTASHDSGKGAKYTHSHKPVDLVLVEGHPTKNEVLQHETALKKSSWTQELLLIEQTGSRTEAVDGNG